MWQTVITASLIVAGVLLLVAVFAGAVIFTSWVEANLKRREEANELVQAFGWDKALRRALRRRAGEPTVRSKIQIEFDLGLARRAAIFLAAGAEQKRLRQELRARTALTQAEADELTQKLAQADGEVARTKNEFWRPHGLGKKFGLRTLPEVRMYLKVQWQ